MPEAVRTAAAVVNSTSDQLDVAFDEVEGSVEFYILHLLKSGVEIQSRIVSPLNRT